MAAHDFVTGSVESPLKKCGEKGSISSIPRIKKDFFEMVYYFLDFILVIVITARNIVMPNCPYMNHLLLFK